MPAERTISMPTAWAEDAQITIPSPPFANTPYRDTGLSAAQIAAGQGYATLLDSSEYNEFLYRVSSMLQLLEQNGILPWSQKTDYLTGAWVMGTDSIVYKAVQPSGPNTGGFKAPPDTDYWENAASVSNDLIYPGAFHDFYKQAPPAGWMVRNGALITNASTAVPKLYEALQLTDNAFMLKTETQWQALSSVAGGVGGVPFFVLNTGVNTIRLPDTRGDYVRNAGSAFLPNVGDWHGDAIPQDLKGSFRITGQVDSVCNGVFYNTGVLGLGINGVSYRNDMPEFGFDPSLVVPTADENRTRAFAMLGCIYVGV